MFERPDWTLFRQLSTLGQKAGVSLRLIPRLVLKELVDNALDVAGLDGFRAGRLGISGIFVEDGGPGFDGDDGEIASFFSVNRPLASSKLLRLPTRGALGNGLRVVVGAVLASGGTLHVSTRGSVAPDRIANRPCLALMARLTSATHSARSDGPSKSPNWLEPRRVNFVASKCIRPAIAFGIQARRKHGRKTSNSASNWASGVAYAEPAGRFGVGDSRS